MRENTVKLDLVDIMRVEGYDFLTACEEVDRVFAEFEASGKRSQTLTVGRTQVTINRREKA